MRITQRREASFSGSTMPTAREVRELLDGLPDETVVRVSVTRGDRPWESDSVTLEAEWQQDQPPGWDDLRTR